MLNAPQCTDEAIELLKFYFESAGEYDFVLPSSAELRRRVKEAGAKIPSKIKAYEWAYLILYAKGWIQLGQKTVNGVDIFEGIDAVDVHEIINPPSQPTCTECDGHLSKARASEGLDICGHCEYLLHL